MDDQSQLDKFVASRGSLPALKAIKYQGVTGTVQFDQNGDIKDGALTLFTYRGGKRTKLDVVR